jgi:hypothetical protein
VSRLSRAASEVLPTQQSLGYPARNCRDYFGAVGPSLNLNLCSHPPLSLSLTHTLDPWAVGCGE